MKVVSVLVTLLCLLVLASSAFAAGPTVGKGCTFQWTEPTTNADATPLVDLKEYRLYLSTTSGSYTTTPAKVIAAPKPNPSTGSNLTTPCPAGIPQGQNYAVMTAADLAGNESVFSNEAPFVLDTVAPGAPITLTPK